MDILKYKGYEGTAELDMSRQVCRGKILFIDDLVTYEAPSPAELQAEFQLAVDDYIDTCSTLGREPKRPLKGMFNVRVPPKLHKAAVLRAEEDHVSLNEVVIYALDAYLNVHSVVNHHFRVTFDAPEESLKTLVASASSPTSWETAHVH